jgi:hypothetical protein
MKIGMLLRTAPLLVGLAWLPACDRGDEYDELDTEEGFETTPADEVPPLTPDPMAGEGVERTAQFESVGEGGASGTLRILDGGAAGTQLAVDLTGLSEGEHAWHIHNAPCGQEGTVVVPFTDTEAEEGIAEPLRVGADGNAIATVIVPSDRLSQDELRSGQYSLHVHERGGVDHGATVACVNLQQQQQF